LLIWHYGRQRTFSTNTYGVLSSPTISSDGWIYVIDLGKHFRYDAFLRKVNIVTGSSIWSTSISQVTCQYDSFSTGYACLKMQPSLVESQNLVIVGGSPVELGVRIRNSGPNPLSVVSAGYGTRL
jgi:outer membrane protein assembly factor BamB